MKMLKTSPLLVLLLLTQACATGANSAGDGGSSVRDSGVSRDGGSVEEDGDVRPEAGPPDASVALPDAAVGPGGFCATCRDQSDCQGDHYCAPLGGGASACMPVCGRGGSDCPMGFRCATELASDLGGAVCLPSSGECCLDGDGDQYGVGDGCRGPDCNDGNSRIHPGAVETCNGADDDCDGSADNGSAEALCPPGPQVATTQCRAGECSILRCNDGYADCNGSVPDGCENPLNTTSDCGACGMSCSLPRATATCGSGRCLIESCDTGFGDCDGMDANGCEASLTTAENCGSCGRMCMFDNATAACAGGMCRLLLCDSGYSNCDGVDANGCEVDHSRVSRSCATADNLGVRDGDVNCGWPGCSSNPFDSTPFATRRGTGSAWFQARVNEDSNCSASIEHRVRLIVPSGVDYDLFVYKSCGGTPVVSRGGTGADEEVTISATDSFASEDDFTYYVEVRYYSGRSCDPWTLELTGRDC